MNSTTGTPWFVKGDINGFFGLFSNVLTNFLTAIGLLIIINVPKDIVFNNIVPSTAIAIGIGGIALAYQAKALSNKENRKDITAMPYGLSVPHYFAVSLGVMLPVYMATKDWTIAWSAGIAWNVVQGIIMTLGAFIGPTINKYIPRPAMLGALAGLAITYISMNPAGEVFTTPYLGFMTLMIILVGWLTQKKMPFNIPAGAFAILVGTILAWVTGYMNPASVSEALTGFNVAYPTPAVKLMFSGFAYIKPFLASAIPLAIYDFLESLDNIESAAAEGEHYNITKAMLIPGLATLVGALLGSVFPTIIYIGHPGWKATGARIGYSWMTGVSVLLISFIGLLPLVLSIIPLVVLLPILIYIGMVIGAQAFGTADKKYYPAIILSFIPLIAGFLTLKINSVLSALNTSATEVGYGVLANAGVPLKGWEALAAGDILIGMLIASIAIFIIDKNYKLASIYCFITGGLAFFGLIHAPEIGIGTGANISLGYLAGGIALLVLNYYQYDGEETTVEKEDELESAV